MPTPIVSIIVLTHNCLEEATRPCMEALFTVKVNTPFNVIVVDNASFDGTQDYLLNLATSHRNIKIILNEENVGFSAGNNIGIKFVCAKFYILLNNDTLVTDYWLDKLVGFFDDHRTVGMVGPVSNSVGNEQLIHTSGSEPGEIISQGLLWAESSVGKYQLTDVLGFFCVAIPHTVIEKVGLLDPEYGIGMVEDDDYCLRVKKSGFDLAIVEDVFVYHKGSTTFKKYYEDTQDLLARNIRYFESKHGVDYASQWQARKFHHCIVNDLESKDVSSNVAFRVVNRLKVIDHIYTQPLRGEIWTLQAKLHDAENIVQKTRAELDERDHSLRAAQQKVLEGKVEIEELRLSAENLRNDVDNANGIIDSLQKILNNMQSMLADVEARNVNLQSTVHWHQKQVEEIYRSNLWMFANLQLNVFRALGLLGFVKHTLDFISRSRSRYFFLLNHIYLKATTDTSNKKTVYRIANIIIKILKILKNKRNQPKSADSVDGLSLQFEYQKVAIVPCAFEFDDLVNQRPINLAKFLSKSGYHVIYVVWQWSAAETLKKSRVEVYPNVIQVGMHDFFNIANGFHSSECGQNIYFITLPSKRFVESALQMRNSGFRLVYDIMDDWEEFSAVGQAPWYELQQEECIILGADVVSAVSPRLIQKFCYLRRDIELVPNGFSPDVLINDTSSLRPQDQPPPGGAKAKYVETDSCLATGNYKVGYFGHLTESWFDWDIIFDAADRFKHISFEIIGYGASDLTITAMANRTNITYLGKVNTSDLHSYVRGWDLAVIPFKHSRLSEAVDPIKIYEYLFFEIPVVATGIPHLDKYPITTVCGRESFSRTILEILENPHDAGSTHLHEFVAQSTWEHRFLHLLNVLNNKSGLQSVYEH